MIVLGRLFASRPDKTAIVAKERLLTVVAHQRMSLSAPSFLPQMQRDLLAVLGRYLDAPPEAVRMAIGRQEGIATLEINVEIDERRAWVTCRRH